MSKCLIFLSRQPIIYLSKWPIFYCLGELLFSAEDFVAVFLLCFGSCICSQINQSIWKWPSSYVLRGIQWAVVYTGVNTFPAHWCVRGKFITLLYNKVTTLVPPPPSFHCILCPLFLVNVAQLLNLYSIFREYLYYYQCCMCHVSGSLWKFLYKS